MPLLSYALCSVADVEKQLGETLAGNDITVCENMINLATQYAEKYIGRNIKARSSDETEVFDIEPNTQDIFVKNFPIISVTSVKQNTTLLTVDVDYLKYSDIGKFTKPYANWTDGYKMVEIVYKGGYATVPEDLMQWCIEIITYMFDTKEDGNIQSERVGQLSVSYGAISGNYSVGNIVAQKPWLKEILDLYKSNFIA
jgi:hypothetical protein